MTTAARGAGVLHPRPMHMEHGTTCRVPEWSFFAKAFQMHSFENRIAAIRDDGRKRGLRILASLLGMDHMTLCKWNLVTTPEAR